MKYIITMVASLLIATSCKNNEQKVENAGSNHERDSIMRIADEREASVNEFIASFNEIERNLDSIAAKQKIISTGSKKGETKLDQKNRINEQIAAINRLMEENTKKISELNRKLRKSQTKNRTLEETIITLNNQLNEKNDELCVLNDKLSEMDIKVAQLHSTIDTLFDKTLAQTLTINNNIVTMHTAYYVIGKSKDLQEAKVIDRKGGLLGIGKTPQLSDNFDSEKFTKIDYTQTPNIPVNSDGVKIITTHPSDSYSLDRDDKDKDLVKNIVITDPDKFWSASKYLVVVKK
jgi:hypothetical protein